MAFRIAEQTGIAVIKVFGVGGGGGNAINSMVRNGLQGVQFISVNTDLQALQESMADVVLQMGPGITKGLGAGADPETGKLAALESLEDLKAAVEGCDMVFVAAGLGGGTGTGAAPVIAKIAKEAGALTVAVVTKPFSFEGKVRARHAEQGWQELRANVDTIITVPNDRLLSLGQKTSKLADMLLMADTVLLQAVRGISNLINVPGLINADFADLRTVMKEVGPAIMGVGSASGENRAIDAARIAIDNQLLEDVGVDGARGVLINVSASSESLTLEELNEVSLLIQEKVDEDAVIVVGALYDDELGDEIRVTVVATGVGGVLACKEVVAKPRVLNRAETSGKTPGLNLVPPGPEAVTHGSPAPKNVQHRATKLPRSSFDSLENLGISGGSGQAGNASSATSGTKRDLELLETPTYLRKNAN
ncbi:cell division protein FtsZ [Desulfotalea psychrophila]|uniref:Cell division protein FtsZ n=1 Tax=Desulfotalea psychrophila (strain LSv54 / DSM 12343) TaxID=177439 RepID=Q6AJ58_DESPS|nr:cell division protein FtsZ [Desulfotalea psychrophila]CAG37622.1 probable cell division protein FtsZ [Desulfotalea psychrophila LSv54]